ncbi:MAG: outer membrane protein assembly factor BamE [Alphaproteobacteria bacterium]|nr:outer membrane protein assembly factor BamE [Alphaproteobacteria bacterium]
MKCEFRREIAETRILLKMSQRTKRTGIALTLALALLVNACAPRVAIRGNLPRQEQMAKIKIGEQNRDEVAEILGTPSTLGTFDDKVWYYISRKTEKFAFLEEEIIDQQVIAVYFSDSNIVQAIHRYTKDDLRQIEMVDRTTPTAGKDLSVLDQLIGNLGRFGRN